MSSYAGTLEVLNIKGNNRHSPELVEEFLRALESIITLSGGGKKLTYELCLWDEQYVRDNVGVSFKYDYDNIDGFINVFDRTNRYFICNPSSALLKALIDLFNTYKPICTSDIPPVFRDTKAFYYGSEIDLSLATLRLMKVKAAREYLISLGFL